MSKTAETHNSQVDTHRFIGLGGRIKSDGSYPTTEEWLADPAHLSDWVFNNNEEVDAFFAPEIAEIGAIMEASRANRESIINQISTLTPRRRNLIRSVIANTFPLYDEGQEYDTRTRVSEFPEPTFEFTIIPERDKQYPKSMIDLIVVKDHLIVGLEDPYSINATFIQMGDRAWRSAPILAIGEPVVSVSLLGKDKDKELGVVHTKGLYPSADPEAIQQTLAFCKELTADIFASPE